MVWDRLLTTYHWYKCISVRNGKIGKDGKLARMVIRTCNFSFWNRVIRYSWKINAQNQLITWLDRDYCMAELNYKVHFQNTYYVTSWSNSNL